MASTSTLSIEKLLTEIEALRQEVSLLRQTREGLDFVVARQAILDCLTLYTRAVDRHDWDLFAEVFHADAICDFGAKVGSPSEIAGWLDGIYPTVVQTHSHFIANHLCEIDGDTAHAETYIVSIGLTKDGLKLNLLSGRYIDRLERRTGKWKIAARRVVIEARGKAEAAVDGQPINVGAAAPQGKWGRDDPAYIRPLVVNTDGRS